MKPSSGTKSAKPLSWPTGATLPITMLFTLLGVKAATWEMTMLYATVKEVQPLMVAQNLAVDMVPLLLDWGPTFVSLVHLLPFAGFPSLPVNVHVMSY